MGINLFGSTWRNVHKCKHWFNIFFFPESKKNGCYKNDRYSWETSGVIELDSGVSGKDWLGCRQKDARNTFFLTLLWPHVITKAFKMVTISEINWWWHSTTVCHEVHVRFMEIGELPLVRAESLFSYFKSSCRWYSLCEVQLPHLKMGWVRSMKPSCWEGLKLVIKVVKATSKVLPQAAGTQ